MTLLSADSMEMAKRAAAVLRKRRHEAVQRVRFGADGDGVPATHVRLGGDAAKAHLQRLAIRGRREEESGQPGAAAELVQHPSVEKAMVEEFSDG